MKPILRAERSTYFKGYYFAGQIIRSVILEAENEEKVKELFFNKYPNRRLIEIRKV